MAPVARPTIVTSVPASIELPDCPAMKLERVYRVGGSVAMFLIFWAMWYAHGHPQIVLGLLSGVLFFLVYASWNHPKASQERRERDRQCDEASHFVVQVPRDNIRAYSDVNWDTVFYGHINLASDGKTVSSYDVQIHGYTAASTETETPEIYVTLVHFRFNRDGKRRYDLADGARYVSDRPPT